MSTQYGTDVIYGSCDVSISGYIVLDVTVGDAEVSTEDIIDCDGTLATRIVNRIWPKVTLTLVPKDGADPETAFPTGGKCTVSPYTGWYVDSCSWVRTGGAASKVTVSMTDIGV